MTNKEDNQRNMNSRDPQQKPEGFNNPAAGQQDRTVPGITPAQKSGQGLNDLKAGKSQDKNEKKLGSQVPGKGGDVDHSKYENKNKKK